MTSNILGYEVSTDPIALTGFLARARQEYTALEKAIAPVDEKIKALRQDWNPRPPRFWHPILYTDIPAIRQAAQACLSLFSKERSTQEAPVPIIISATSLGYTIDLYQIVGRQGKIEEVGILLTAHLNTPESSSIERQIRERQRLLNSLEDLSKVVHEALDKGRAKLDTAEEGQARILSPKEPKANQPETGKETRQKFQTKPALQIVTGDNGEGAK